MKLSWNARVGNTRVLVKDFRQNDQVAVRRKATEWPNYHYKIH